MLSEGEGHGGHKMRLQKAVRLKSLVLPAQFVVIAGIGVQCLWAQDVTAGKRQFAQTCGFCHGPDGRGASGPDLLRSSLVSHDVNGNLIGEVVRNGRPAKGMPAFPLSDAEIKAIADFLHAEAKLAASVTQRNPTEYPLEKLLVGNAEAGEAYFNGAGKCSKCHSVTGDLAHIASKYKPFDLQARIAFPSGAVPKVTVTEKTGRQFSGDQVYSDEFLISLRDAQGWVHTWKRGDVKVEAENPLAAHEKLLTTYTDRNIHDLFAYLVTLK
jgi:cytochrome c oxidase cbb3-type subunit III